ncbi:SIS domain-containing protein [Actinophytocola sp.]|uniref:SIS domain-containing protein n=1 Tax=Actinophytocola sp. TaxID=1872138 RepID=UPI0039C8896C
MQDGLVESYAAAEIRRQPESWSRAIGLAAGLTATLPAPGERVAVIGCGTSWYMAAAYAALREETGAGETDAFAASQFPENRNYDRVVAISRSGTTTEVLRALRTARPRTVAITAVGGSPIAELAGEAVVLDFADERSVVQTVFATTALMLLRASLGADLEPVIQQADAVLGQEFTVELGAQVTFLGDGWAYGVAREAALKLREAAGVWTEAYPQLEYRHGPIAIAEPGRAVWVFGEPAPGIAADVAATGAELIDDALDPVADLVRAQLLAVAWAHERGLDPDRPRGLTRSIVLPTP